MTVIGRQWLLPLLIFKKAGMNNLLITDVVKGSIAEEAGIYPGDILVSVNRNKILDVFDYWYHVNNEEVEFEISRSNNETLIIQISKDESEDIGLVFENSLMSKEKHCSNKCIFCFVDQLPKNMRNSLYFKDDDTRLSFLYGNYVTLTNIKDSDIDRIIGYKMSPVNISVHATDKNVRNFMLGNKVAGSILEKIKKLAEGNILINCQIVACPGINDGDVLEGTFYDLLAFWPHLQSISVVPVGITKHRDSLYNIEGYNHESACKLLNQVKKLQKTALKKTGSNFIYAADELYIMCGEKLPTEAHYEGFPQLENGVGMMSKFTGEFNRSLSKRKPAAFNRNISIGTGVLAYPYIKGMAERICKKFSGVYINTYEIKNGFFGEKITVSGLLTGNDVISSLRGKNLGQELLLPENLLKKDEDVLLDDYTLSQLEDILEVKIKIVYNHGSDFIDSVLYEKAGRKWQNR